MYNLVLVENNRVLRKYMGFKKLNSFPNPVIS